MTAPKVVLDTSVFVSAVKSPALNSVSSPARVLAAWIDDRFLLVMSPALLQELTGVLVRLNIAPLAIAKLTGAIAARSISIPGNVQATRLDKIDPKDNPFLAAAYEAKADYLVSLDARHLLPIKHFHRTQIVTPELFLRFLDRHHS